MNLRIVFMGSPEFAVPTLNALAENYRVEGVATQPDRPAGRGREVNPPAVKILAHELNLPVIQPAKLGEAEAIEQLKAWQPDVIVVAAFGQILRSEVLDLPPHGCVNVHASLLPRWRGAAPIQAAILHGDEETGITILKMDPGVDSGPILSQQAIPIRSEDTAGSLSPRLAELGARLLLETLPSYMSGEIQPQHQDDSQATYAPMLKKSDGELDFSQPAEDLARRVRAFNPWPGTFFLWQGERLKVHQAHAAEAPSPPPGETVSYEGLPAVGTGDGLLVLEEVQPAGKTAMAGEDFLHGARGWGKEQ